MVSGWALHMIYEHGPGFGNLISASLLVLFFQVSMDSWAGVAVSQRPGPNQVNGPAWEIFRLPRNRYAIGGFLVKQVSLIITQVKNKIAFHSIK